MILDLKKYLASQNESDTVEYSFEVQEKNSAGKNLFETPVKVKAKLTSFSGSCKLEFEASVVLAESCDRCGKEISYDIEVKQNHILVSKLSNEEDEGEMIEADISNFDLDELVYSDIMLNLPSKILCRETCKGLCPSCGKDLNEGPCECGNEIIDARLEILRQLLDS